MSSHTPGPWTVQQGHYPGFIAIKGPSFDISVVTTATDLDFKDYCSRTADAALIASAPDLLALCVQSRALMSAMLAEELNVQECIRNISKVNVLRTKIAALSLAIDRAKGGEV